MPDDKTAEESRDVVGQRVVCLLWRFMPDEEDGMKNHATSGTKKRAVAVVIRAK
jgi:hypothetical protein